MNRDREPIDIRMAGRSCWARLYEEREPMLWGVWLGFSNRDIPLESEMSRLNDEFGIS